MKKRQSKTAVNQNVQGFKENNSIFPAKEDKDSTLILQLRMNVKSQMFDMSSRLSVERADRNERPV